MGVSTGTRYGGPAFDVVEQVRDTVARYGMLGKGDKVLVAASGGPDSTCLLDVLGRLATKLDLQLEVAHVDHGLSEDSETVASRVSTEGATAGYDVHVMRISELSGPNLQAKARDLRYRFLDSIADRIGADRIATGHTLDDRVETTLARLIHGAGTEGLAGLPPAEGRRIRPLIDLRRARTRAYCEEVELDFYDDPANDDESFERVAIRRLLVAAVEERWGAGAVAAMAASSERLWEDSAALAEIADRLYADLAVADGDEVSFRTAALAAMPRALRRRVFERAVGRVRDRAGGIEGALDALEKEIREEVRFAVAGGAEIAVGRENVTVVRSTTSPETGP